MNKLQLLESLKEHHINLSSRQCEIYIERAANKIAIAPDIPIKRAVPKSGCNKTKKTGIKKLRKGIKICFTLLIFCDGILL